MTININNERQIRLEKTQKLREQGINPYPASVKRKNLISDVLENFENSKKVQVVGRIRLLRRHGGSTFMRIEDESGNIQLFVSKKETGEEKYNLLKLFDLGDFVSVSGSLFTTKTEEKTIATTDLKIISKAIRPLPEKFHGLKDDEEKARHRYLDLIANPQVRELFKKRSQFINEIRMFMNEKGFMEVETPVLEHIPGGAEAEPFITHHNTLDIDLYLRISLELHLKRLIVGGYEKIFELGRVFRNEGMSTQHLQEFTMIEFYWAYADNLKLMNLVEELFQTVINNTFGTLKIKYKDIDLDFSGKWERLDYFDQFKKYSGIDLNQVTDKTMLKKAIKTHNIDIKIDSNSGYGRLIDQVYKKTVRPNLQQPCFLINHPLAISPLAKKDSQNPKIVQRHQILIMGLELGNGFSELNDPIDQNERFAQQTNLREQGDKEAQMFDHDFIEALEYGMPPTAGFGVGIDRLFMLLANQNSIRDVVFFPTLRAKKE